MITEAAVPRLVDHLSSRVWILLGWDYCNVVALFLL